VLEGSYLFSEFIWGDLIWQLVSNLRGAQTTNLPIPYTFSIRTSVTSHAAKRIVFPTRLLNQSIIPRTGPQSAT
jgi:hypothetical protein